MYDGRTPLVRLPRPVNKGELDSPFNSPQPESSKGKGGDAVVTVGRTVEGRRQKNDTGAASTTTTAPAVAAILTRYNKEVIDINDGDVVYSYFGSSPNPDPGDYSPGDITNNYVGLFVHSNKCIREYKKDRKIQIFYEALTVKMKIILGDSPS